MLMSPPPTGYSAPSVNQQSVPTFGQSSARNMQRPSNFSNAFSKSMPALSQNQAMQNPQMAMILKMLQGSLR